MGTVKRRNKGPQTAADLLDVMSDTIQRLQDDEVSPAVANAIIGSTATMVRIVKLQMEYAKITGQTPDVPLLSSGS
jgi:hypothetical protein